MRKALIAIVFVAGVARADRIEPPEAQRDTRATVVVTDGDRVVEMPVDDAARLMDSAPRWHIETRQERDAREEAARKGDEPRPWWHWLAITIGAGALIAGAFTAYDRRRRPHRGPRF